MQIKEDSIVATVVLSSADALSIVVGGIIDGCEKANKAGTLPLVAIGAVAIIAVISNAARSLVG